MIGVLITSSALMLALSYVWPEYCLLFITSFLIPIFHRVLSSPRAGIKRWASYGFVWGICFFSLHLIFIIPVLTAYTPLVYRCILYVLLVVYGAIGSALWFFFSALLSRVLSKQVSWIICSWVYFIWLEQYALLPYGFPGGYPFANPIFLIAHEQKSRVLLALFGSSLLLLICIGVQMSVLIMVRWQRVPQVAMFYAFLLIGWITINNTSKDQVLPIYCIAPFNKSFATCLDCAQALTSSLIDAIAQEKTTDLFLLPEGAFPYPLNMYPEVISMWTDNIVYEDKHLFIGSYYQENDQLFNCIYHINQGRIINIYRKKLLMPFTEYIPSFKQTFYPHSLFFPHNKKNFTAGGNSNSQNKNSVVLPGFSEITLALCSDFYLSPLSYQQAQTIFLLVNDTWFMPYMKQLLYLYAQSCAYEYRNNLVYSSYVKRR